jgi:hypothetical protein
MSLVNKNKIQRLELLKDPDLFCTLRKGRDVGKRASTLTPVRMPDGESGFCSAEGRAKGDIAEQQSRDLHQQTQIITIISQFFTFSSSVLALGFAQPLGGGRNGRSPTHNRNCKQ